MAHACGTANTTTTPLLTAEPPPGVTPSVGSRSPIGYLLLLRSFLGSRDQKHGDTAAYRHSVVSG